MALDFSPRDPPLHGVAIKHTKVSCEVCSASANRKATPYSKRPLRVRFCAVVRRPVDSVRQEWYDSPALRDQKITTGI